MDADAVYQQAVQKLRLLLTASEAASSDMEEEGAAAAMTSLSEAGVKLTDPQVRTGRFSTNPRLGRGPSARRALDFSGAGDAEREARHRSWHNLTHIGGAGADGDD